MPSIKAVADPDNSPNTGQARQRSGLTSPYYDLNESIKVAKVIQDNGGIATREQLAAYLTYKSVSNGAFLTRVSAARLFGLVEQAEEGKMRPTARAMAIIAPILPAHEDQARLEAFLSIDLFKKVYDRFNGGQLPPEVGLKNLIENEYHIVKDRVAPTVRILLDSAEQAGFFKATQNRSRMVMPTVGSTANLAPPAPKPEQEAQDRRGGGGFGGGGGNGYGPDIPPAIVGLVQHLPKPGTALSQGKREALINAFTAMIDLYYTGGDSA